MLYNLSNTQYAQGNSTSNASILFILEYITIFGFIAACIIITTILIIKHEKDRHGK